MAKTNYQVTFNGKVVGIRKSDRIYTHAVVVQDDADAFYHRSRGKISSADVGGVIR